jgi:hypothetical protein
MIDDFFFVDFCVNLDIEFDCSSLSRCLIYKHTYLQLATYYSSQFFSHVECNYMEMPCCMRL